MMLPDSMGAGLPMTSCFLPDGCGVHGCGRVRCECRHALPQGISRKLHGISCIERLDRMTRCSTDDVIRQGHDATGDRWCRVPGGAESSGELPDGGIGSSFRETCRRQAARDAAAPATALEAVLAEEGARRLDEYRHAFLDEWFLPRETPDRDRGAADPDHRSLGMSSVVPSVGGSNPDCRSRMTASRRGRSGGSPTALRGGLPPHPGRIRRSCR